MAATDEKLEVRLGEVVSRLSRAGDNRLARTSLVQVVSGQPDKLITDAHRY